MKDFQNKGKALKFWSITGEVLSQNKFSETHVSSSGGGGYVGKSGGHVSAPTVRSSTSINQEFWIKTDDGKEKSVQLYDQDIPIREGQKITLISGGLKGKDPGYKLVLVNHNSKEHWLITKAQELNSSLRAYVMTGKSLLIAGGIWGVLNIVTNDGLFASYAAFFFIVFRLVQKYYGITKFNKALDKHIEALAQEAYKAN